jgi:hypothetical protein
MSAQLKNILLPASEQTNQRCKTKCEERVAAGNGVGLETAQTVLDFGDGDTPTEHPQTFYN